MGWGRGHRDKVACAAVATYCPTGSVTARQCPGWPREPNLVFHGVAHLPSARLSMAVPLSGLSCPLEFAFELIPLFCVRWRAIVGDGSVLLIEKRKNSSVYMSLPNYLGGDSTPSFDLPSDSRILLRRQSDRRPDGQGRVYVRTRLLLQRWQVG
jgi:hypothetical protein